MPGWLFGGSSLGDKIRGNRSLLPHHVLEARAQSSSYHEKWSLESCKGQDPSHTSVVLTEMRALTAHPCDDGGACRSIDLYRQLCSWTGGDHGFLGDICSPL
jgi:hypothetical protein